MLANAMGRLKIATKIYAGFGIVLGLLITLGTMNYFGLVMSKDRADEQARVGANAQEELRIKSEIGDLRREAVYFIYTGSEDNLRNARDVGAKLRADLEKLSAEFQAEERQRLARTMGGSPPPTSNTSMLSPACVLAATNWSTRS